MGNVLVTISDRRIQTVPAPNGTSGVTADLMSATDYFPFGASMPGRNFTSATGYRYGFGGQEKDDEIYGSGNAYTADYWEYDPRLGRRWNTDPVVKSFESPYATFSNNPIYYNDSTGAEPEGGEEKPGFTGKGGSGKGTEANPIELNPIEISPGGGTSAPADATKVSVNIPNFAAINRAARAGNSPFAMPEQFKASLSAKIDIKGISPKGSVGSENGIEIGRNFGKFEPSIGITNEGVTLGTNSDWGFMSLKDETKSSTLWQSVTLEAGPKRSLSFVQRLTGDDGYDQHITRTVPLIYTQTFQSVSFGIAQQQRVINKVNFQTVDNQIRSGLRLDLGKGIKGVEIGIKGEINGSWH